MSTNELRKRSLASAVSTRRDNILLAREAMANHVRLGAPGEGRTGVLLAIYEKLVAREIPIVVFDPRGDVIRRARDAAISAAKKDSVRGRSVKHAKRGGCDDV
jgi:hypothetical protein